MSGEIETIQSNDNNTISSTRKSSSNRAADPNRDYKKHFTKQKEAFSLINSDFNRRKIELSRASLKQIKLDEEISFLIEAIRDQQERRKIILEELNKDGLLVKQDESEDEDDDDNLDDLLDEITKEKSRKSANDNNNSQVKKKSNFDFDSDSSDDADAGASAAAAGGAGGAATATSAAADDEILNDLLDNNNVDKKDKPNSPKQSNNKRPRPSFSDSDDDEILDAIGATATSTTSSKRARND